MYRQADGRAASMSGVTRPLGSDVAPGLGNSRNAPAGPGGTAQPWSPPTAAEFEAQLRAALTGLDDVNYRMNLGWECWSLMGRIWERRVKAADARSKWDWLRYAAAVLPVVAAGAGGSLVAHLHGTAGAIIGWVSIIGGLAGAAIGAVRPAVEYGVDLKKASDFEQLYWDVYSYTMAKLRTDEVESIASALSTFAKRMAAIAMISSGSTATAT
jgi:hypothetical protein